MTSQTQDPMIEAIQQTLEDHQIQNAKCSCGHLPPSDDPAQMKRELRFHQSEMISLVLRTKKLG